MVDMFYPIGSVYISAEKSKTKADFPFMAYGTWEEVPANLCLQTGNASHEKLGVNVIPTLFFLHV